MLIAFIGAALLLLCYILHFAFFFLWPFVSLPIASGEDCLMKAYEKMTILIHTSLLTVSNGNLHCDDNSDGRVSLACQSYTTSFDAV